MEDSNNVVGTAATICYENRFAWIGMVLVDPEYRKQGIGTQLLNKTIEHLDHIKHFTIKLDATPLGKPLYTKLGFISEFEIERWTLKRPATFNHTVVTTAPLTECQESELFRLDRELFGADRSFLLRSLCKQAPELAMTIWQDGMPHLLPSDVTAYLPTTSDHAWRPAQRHSTNFFADF